MNRLIDTLCPSCGHVEIDTFVTSLEPARLPSCHTCGVQVQRAWLSAPCITPQGTRPERRGAPRPPERVNTKAIVEDTKFEIEQKWQRYSDPQIAEQHVSREINEAAGIADAAGNEKPVPTPAPLTFAKPTAA